MLFQRRKPASLTERMRLWLWPRRSFARSLNYLKKRLLRISASPHAVALGLAIGLFSASSPLFGLHFIIAALLAWLLRGNLAAALLGTLFSNPVTFFPIIMSDYKIGYYALLPFSEAEQIPLSELRTMFEGITLSKAWTMFIEAWDIVMKPMLVGGVLLGLILGALAYVCAYRAIYKFQKMRSAKIAEKIRMSNIENTQKKGTGNFAVIVGVGNDLIDIKRVEKTLERYGQRFIQRVFTDVEIKKSEGRKKRAASYAKRFAAKEAMAKALGTGIAKGVFWKDMGVVNLPSGKPTMHLTNGALKILQKLTPNNHEMRIHLTISDDDPFAQAFVIIEAVPRG